MIWTALLIGSGEYIRASQNLFLNKKLASSADCAELRQRRTEKQCEEQQDSAAAAKQLMQGQLQSTKLLGAGITTVCQEVVADEVEEHLFGHPKSQEFHDQTCLDHVQTCLKCCSKDSTDQRNHDCVETCSDLIKHDQLPACTLAAAQNVSVLEPVSVDSDCESDVSETSETTEASEATTVIDVDEIINLNLQAEDLQHLDGMKYLLCYFSICQNSNILEKY